MEKIESIKELQSVSIYVYKQLKLFCDNNGLSCYLLGGSLIGAIREQGFIAWDDDIDICMSRTDYDKMLLISKGKISDKCSIIDPASDKNFKGYISLAVYDDSKLVSQQYREKEDLKIGVSIFVYDGVPLKKMKRKLYYTHMYLLRSLHALCRADFKHVNSKPAKFIGPILSVFFNSNRVYAYKKKILELQKKFKYENSEFVAPNTDTNAWLEVFPKEQFEKSVDVMFEGIDSKAFSYYDEHLKRYYGDYMTPPPESNREPKHSFSAWIDDKSFYSNEDV